MDSLLDKSDHMICNTKSARTFKHRKENDLMFYAQVNNAYGPPSRNMEHEFSILTGTDPRVCTLTPHIASRGGNLVSKCPDQLFCQGYSCFTPYYMPDYLMIPCTENTFRNYVVCDENKCCSLRHQMFMNLTKRK